MAQIPNGEYNRLRAISAMDFELQRAPTAQLTHSSLGIGLSALIRAAPPDKLVEIARTHGRTQTYSHDVGIPLEDTPTGDGSVYSAVLGELIRRYESVLGSAMRQRDAPSSVEV